MGQGRVRGDCTRMAAESPHPGCSNEASRELARDSLAWRVAVLACLIVERIDSESAEVVYVWGDYPQGHFKAGWGRFKAKVLPCGILEFGWWHTKLVFEMREDRKTIQGARVQGGTIPATTMRRAGP